MDSTQFRTYSLTVIFWILTAGAIFRILAAWLSIGFDHPNEILRLLEPIASLEGYAAHPPWEWTQKLLSPIPVWIHLGIFHLFESIGISDPISQTRLLRIFYGLLGLLPVYATWKVLSSTTQKQVALGGALFVALWPEFIYRSVRLMDYAPEAALLAGVLLLLWSPPKGLSWDLSRNLWRLAAAGVLLGLLFFVRYQTGLYLIGAMGVIFLGIRPQPLRSALVLAGCYGVTLLLVGWIELKFSGNSVILEPFRNYIQFNWTHSGAARDYGVQPWHRYISEFFKFYGFGPAILIAALLIRSMTVTTSREWVFFALLPIVIHSFIPHKEGRFLYGELWTLVPASLATLGMTEIRLTRPLQIAGIALLALGALINGQRISRVLTLFADDVYRFRDLGLTLNGTLPIRVEADPIFNPGVFFLRTSGKVCYTGECLP